MLKYTRSILEFILIALLVSWVLRTCYNTKQKEASYQDTIAEQDSQRLKEVDSLKYIIRQIPEHVYITEKKIVTVNDTTTDTLIITEKHYIPVENPEVIYVIDTTGKIIDLIYSTKGLCFKPQVVLQYTPFGVKQDTPQVTPQVNYGLGVRWIYWNRWGLNSGLGIYPDLYGFTVLSYRLSQLKLGNCDIHTGTIWNGRFIFTVGVGIYLN